MSCSLAVVQYIGVKHCFLHVVETGFKKSSATKLTSQLLVYEVSCKDGSKVFASLQGDAALSSECTVQIAGLYANKLGIQDGETVMLKSRSECHTASRVDIEPLSVDDWEILERHATFVESHLLDQVRVVWPGQTLPVWVDKSVCIFLKVCQTDPQTEFVVLQNETEVVVSPKSRPGATKPQIPTSLSPPSNFSNGDVSPRSEDLKDFVDGNKAPRRSPRNSKERTPRKFRKHQSDRYSTSLSETELLNNLKPQGNLRRQNSLTDSLWTKVAAWLQWSKDPHQVSSLHDLPKVRMSERSDAYTLPWQNFVFRIQAMQFSGLPEDFYSCQNVSVAKQDKRLSSSARRDLPSPSRESQGDLNGSTPISALPCKQKSPKHETRDCDNIAHLFQPTTIFANIEDISKKLDAHGVKGHLPCVFYAKLKKLMSPKDKEEEEKRRKSEPQKEASSPATTPSSPTPAKKEDAVDSLRCVVRVVGVDKRGLLAAEGWDAVARRLQEEQPLVHGHILVPDVLRRLLKLDVTGRVWLHTVPLKPDKDIKKLFIYPLSILPRFVTKDMIVKSLSLYLEHCASDEHPLVVFQGLLLKFMLLPGLHIEVQLTFSDQEPGPGDQFCLLTAGLLQQMTVSVMKDVKDAMLGVLSPMLPHRYVSDFDPQVPTVTLADLGGMECLSAKALHHLEMCLGTQPLSRHLLHHAHGLVNGMMLVTGPKGSGKSSLARALCRRLAELPTLAHITVVECKPLRGKRVDNIQKGLEVAFDEATWRQPAAILLDDLDVICGAPGGPEFELSGEALYAARVAEVVQSLIRFEIKNNSRLAVIAVSQSRGSLHPLLMSSRGIHFIQETIAITPPDKTGRQVLLEKIVKNRRGLCLEENLDLMAVAVKTEGYVARDFDKLVSRAMHAQYISNRKKGVPETEGEVVLRQEDLEKALTGFQPASLRNVPLHTAGELGWEDIGGLSSVKKTLVETLMWPSKYPQLFANCPLRLRSGLLLYGAPGTGKTLLAGVVAKECGLNFISIKGPELLSKYIGASEQAVRDLFTRAQSAKPCILFFDEFDSLAPRRGHDSTGVTDRVVNQLLTELDGVEGLEGVYVLGATSRPDLIDPALLRPGRLDKCLHCQLPSESERLEILKALTRKMRLGVEVDLPFIAAKTEFFSGADLKALLYNAQLEAIHEAAEVVSPPYFQDKESEVFLPPSAKTPSPPVVKDQAATAMQPCVKSMPVGENHITPDLLSSIENAVASSKQTEGQEPQEMPVVPARSTPVQGSAVARAVLKKGASVERVRKLSRRGSQLKLKSFRSLQVAFIPRLEDGPQELTLEEEDKVLALVNELRKRDARRAQREQSECGEGDKGPGLVEVTQPNLESALEVMHPSMSRQERDNFDRIYKEFTSSRRGDGTANLNSIGKRATLA